MRIGMFISETSGERTGIDSLLATAAWAESSNLATGWVPHIPWSLDALTALTLVGRETTRIELGTAVVSTYPRHPLALAQQALSTQAACGGRLLLGIGPSHPVVIEKMHGLSYEKPARHVREYVDVLDRAFAGPGQVEYAGETYAVDALLDVPDSSPVPIMLAALAPLMLKLAGSRTEGTITWMGDERAHAEHVVPRITAAAAEAGRPAPRVVAGLPIAVCDDADEGRERAARLFAAYEQIPTYRRMLDRGDAGSPAEVSVIGTEEQVTKRLQSYRDAGVTDLAAAVFAVGDDREASRRRTRDLLASLAPEL
ncbi:MAG TPA: TIGR03564 family F420-dependent LLM class oxidoreductase [Acidimicrobiia bacterium]|nr:TIGR03564 family F420-dependent LLM class oxidoreductase [Acidimicrobiia bacterium]